MTPNPIIPGFAPDPSITRINDTFYLVNSSFHLFPGLPIFASKDLVSWRHIGNAINRPAQLSLARSATKLNLTSSDSGDKAPATGGLYAPTIRHHNGITYIVCTNVIFDAERDTGDWISGLRFQNFIISTPDICLCQWSDPIYFDFQGIDPDLFFNDDGRAYVSGSYWVPSPSCCIACFEINIATGRKLSQDMVLWHGHTGIIPEGPHIYKRGGYYYLLIAEGGTHEGHCISISRASSIWGPYEACPKNPILPPADGTDPTSICHHNGHGDFVQDSKRDWWLVFLGVRRDRVGRMALGRETFLAAVDWPDEHIWPRVHQPNSQVLSRNVIMGSGACEYNEYTASDVPGESIPSSFLPKIDLVWIRDPEFNRCQVSQDSTTISLLSSCADLDQCTGEPISFIGRRIRRLQWAATAELILSSALKNNGSVRIGMAYFKDEYRYARISYEPRKQLVSFDCVNYAKSSPLRMKTSVEVVCSRVMGKIQFRILYTEKLIHFLYRTNQKDCWSEWYSRGLVDTLDMTGNDFVGPVIGVFAVGEGEEWCTFENVNI